MDIPCIPWLNRNSYSRCTIAPAYIILLICVSLILFSSAIERQPLRLAHTIIEGASQKPPAVILHGLLSNARQMKTFAQQLHKHLDGQHSVICIDLPNHGQSRWLHGSVRPMDYNSLAGDIRYTLQCMDVFDCHLLGSSIGGKTAAALALQTMEQGHKGDMEMETSTSSVSTFDVSSLILMDVCPTAYELKNLLRVSPTICFVETIEYLMTCRLELSEANSRQQIERILRSGLKDSALISFLLSNIVKVKGSHDQVHADDRFQLNFMVEDIHACLASLATFPSYSQPSPITTPCIPTLLYKASESTHVTQSIIDESKKLFPQLSVLSEDGCTHKMLFERPDKIAMNVAKFITSLPS